MYIKKKVNFNVLIVVNGIYMFDIIKFFKVY